MIKINGQSLHCLLLVLGLLSFFFVQRSLAQQQIIYNQYLQNPYYVNPAFSGVDGITEFVLLAREQWIGYTERPRTYSLNFQMNLLDNPVLGTPVESKSVRRGSSARTTQEIFRNASMGVSGTLINDVNGRVRRTGIQAAYSYQILAGDWMLAGGLGMSFMQYKVNVLPNDLFDMRIDDPLVAAGKPIKGYAPDFNIGFAISNGRYWGGLSVTSLLQNSLQFGTYNNSNIYRQLSQLYLLSGYKIELRKGVIFEPSAILTINQRAQWTADINFKVESENRFWGAVGYRTFSDITVSGGVRYNRLTFGYAFSYTVAGPEVIGKYGTHELMVGFRVAPRKLEK